MRVVVVGNGMAGARFTQELVARDPDRRCALTVIGDEPGLPYNRVLLSNVLAGVARPDAIELVGADWYADHDVRLRSGVAVAAIEREARTVRLADGGAVDYDVLVLATGSVALIPPVPGLRDDTGGLRPGVALFRTRDDCAAIDRLARSARRVVVVGAGVLGLEAARGLAGRGRWVTVVQRETRLMERQLDTPAARLLGRALDRLGVEVRSGVTVAEVLGTGVVSGVTLSDGDHLDADLVVLCCGVRPRTELAEAAGLKVDRGVLVDDRLATFSDDAVYAIGECAEHAGRLYGLVAPVWEQARVAAAAIAEPETSVRYAGTTQVTRLKASGIELATLGDASALDEDDLDEDDELVTWVDRARGVYLKLVLREDRITAAILLGDTRAAAAVTQLFDRGAAVPADRAGLLLPRRSAAVTAASTPTALPAGATICQCNGVTKAAITGAWQAGARSLDAIAEQTRATTGCGSCRDTVCGLLDWLAQADPAQTRVADVRR